MENGTEGEQAAHHIIEQLAGENVDTIQITFVQSDDHQEPTEEAVVVSTASDDHVMQVDPIIETPVISESPVGRQKRLRKSTTPSGTAKKYRKEWEFNPKYEAWLAESSTEGYASCLVCECDIDISKGKTQLTSHATSREHIENMEASGIEESSTPARFKSEDLQPSSTKRSTLKPSPLKSKRARETMQAEAKIMAFILENNLPISLVDRLVALIKNLPSVGPAIRSIHLGKQKATNMIRQGFAPFFQDILVEKLKNTLFSVIVDEAPDLSKKTKLLAIFVCFANEDLQMEVDLLEFVETDGSLKQAYAILKESIRKVQNAGVDVKNWIGFRSDFSMARSESPSLFEMVKEDFPWVIMATCPIHIAQQATSSACEALPDKLEEALRSIHDHFKASTKQEQTFVSPQEFSQLVMEKSPSQTKWLSVHGLVKVVTEKWAELQVHFTNAIIEDSVNGTDVIMEVLLNPIMRVMLLFSEYVLGIVADYCEAFRSDEPVFYNLRRVTYELIHTFAKSFMTRESVVAEVDPMKLNVTEDGSYLPLSQIYLGYEASSALTAHMEQYQLDENDSEVVRVLTTAQGFYKRFITEIQSGLDFSSPVYKFVDLINPVKAYNTDPPSLVEFFSSFGHPDWSKRAMEEEWRSLCLLQLPHEETLQSPLVFWKFVLDTKTPTGMIRFQHIQTLMMFFMSLPYASDVINKIQDLMKDVRTDSRKYLKTVTLSAVLRSHCGLRRMPDALQDPHLRERLRGVRSNAKSGDCDDIPILLTK